jgi:hypothetical protein
MHHKMQLEHSNCLEKLFISVHSCSAYGTDWRVNAKFAASLFFFFSNLEAISRPFAKGVTGSSAFGTRRFLTGGSAQGVSGTGTEDVSDAGVEGADVLLVSDVLLFTGTLAGADLIGKTVCSKKQ